jgi:hypothetical protein
VQKYNALKPRQQEYIRRFFTGLLIETEDEKPEIEGEYTRAFLRYMSSKHCDMEWAPAWIVKDKSRQTGVGIYSLPEVVEWADEYFAKQAELPAADGETMIIGTQVVQV